MLSATDELDDMKMELEPYDFYGFVDTVKFDAKLTYALTVAKRNTMIPIIGEGRYDEIEAKDKTGLTTKEEYIYYAEVNYGISEFMMLMARKDKYRRRAYSETKSESNVSRSTRGTIGKEMAADDYSDIGDDSLMAADYDMTLNLKRRFPVFGDDSSDVDGSFQ